MPPNVKIWTFFPSFYLDDDQRPRLQTAIKLQSMCAYRIRHTTLSMKRSKQYVRANAFCMIQFFFSFYSNRQNHLLTRPVWRFGRAYIAHWVGVWNMINSHVFRFIRQKMCIASVERDEMQTMSTASVNSHSKKNERNALETKIVLGLSLWEMASFDNRNDENKHIAHNRNASFPGLVSFYGLDSTIFFSIHCNLALLWW